MRTALLMSVDSASGCGIGPGSIRVTSSPLRRSSSAAVTPKMPAPQTKTCAIAPSYRIAGCLGRDPPGSLRFAPLVYSEGSVDGRLVIAERFEIEHLVGAGGMGEVFRAKDRLTGGPVAVKLLHPGMMRDQERFRREAQL